MRNKFPGTCYRCDGHVAAGEGHFERFRGGWRVQHASCAIEHRGERDPERWADTISRWKRQAEGAGPKARKARQRLRNLEQDPKARV